MAVARGSSEPLRKVHSLLLENELYGKFCKLRSIFDKQKLLGISKRGNSYLRRLFVQGARAVMRFRGKQSSGLNAWLEQLTSRTHPNIAIVALANKLARMAWAVLAKDEPYGPSILASAAAA